jgi:hypothetical protein
MRDDKHNKPLHAFPKVSHGSEEDMIARNMAKFVSQLIN